MNKRSNDWYENEALHRAAMVGNINDVEQLMRSGYSINTFDDLGLTPLHYAVRNEHYKIARLLLESGANVNAHDPMRISNTPLAIAVEGKYPQMVKLLLSFDADPSITGWMGLDAYKRADKNKHEEGNEIRKLLLAVRVIE